MAKTAVIYLRVSTERQARKGGSSEGYSIPAQRDACLRKAKELGAEVIAEYVDAGESARGADRPQLKAMLADLQTPTGAADFVLVQARSPGS
jgi:DNA invertase Pin-like site-specific DNA recombinase